MVLKHIHAHTPSFPCPSPSLSLPIPLPWRGRVGGREERLLKPDGSFVWTTSWFFCYQTRWLYWWLIPAGFFVWATSWFFCMDDQLAPLLPDGSFDDSSQLVSLYERPAGSFLSKPAGLFVCTTSLFHCYQTCWFLCTRDQLAWLLQLKQLVFKHKRKHNRNRWFFCSSSLLSSFRQS